MCMSWWRHTSDASPHLIFRELFKEAMFTVCKVLNNNDEYRYVYVLMETHQRCITPFDI